MWQAGQAGWEGWRKVAQGSVLGAGTSAPASFRVPGGHLLPLFQASQPPCPTGFHAALLSPTHCPCLPPTPCCRYVYDWDNVFWPMNLLLAQETGRSTFKDQSELFLKNWICAGNVANYTQRGRSYNPWSGALPCT